jgi:spermidine synthase
MASGHAPTAALLISWRRICWIGLGTPEFGRLEVHVSLTRRSALRLAGVSAILVGSRNASARQNELVRESIYNYIIVSRDNSIVSFRRMENGAAVSTVDVDLPSYQIIPYTKYLFAGALLDPNPNSVLNIGLGAGSFNRLFNQAYPDATLTTVEIDPMIRDLAVEFTSFAETARNKVVIEDGRRFLHRSSDLWDWIVIDAFVRNSQYPPHLATLEFFRLAADHLTDGGLLTINIIRGNKLFDCLVTTIAAAFEGCLVFDVPGKGNAVVVASKNKRSSLEHAVQSSAPAIAPLLLANGVDLNEIAAGGSAPTPGNCSGALTDDYSPTEFLGGQQQK